MPARPPFSGDGTRPIPRPPDRNTASAYEYVTGRSKPAALSGTRQPRGDPMASSRFRLRLSGKGPAVSKSPMSAAKLPCDPYLRRRVLVQLGTPIGDFHRRAASLGVYPTPSPEDSSGRSDSLRTRSSLPAAREGARAAARARRPSGLLTRAAAILFSSADVPLPIRRYDERSSTFTDHEITVLVVHGVEADRACHRDGRGA